MSEPLSEPLWRWDELLGAAEGTADGVAEAAVNGVSIDTRRINAGDLFVALSDSRDGHEFVGEAFAKGAAAALVSVAYNKQPGDGALIRVADPLRALEAIGRAARARSSAGILAITGSAGKTGSKEALRHCLALLGKTHASEKSYNNHWGVPLSLARLPRDAAFAVFEIGMNHPGEIAPLAAMVRPQVALITNVEPVHLAQFESVARIADAKAEIFCGLESAGTAILNRDNAYYEQLKAAAMAKGARVMPFGENTESVALLVSADYDSAGSDVCALIEGTRVSYRIAAPGAHQVRNSLGVLAGVKALGGDVVTCATALAGVKPVAGRGRRSRLQLPDGAATLIDESYNANPASMAAALGVLGASKPQAGGRRIAVLGDMLELGARSVQLHRDLGKLIERHGIDLVFACGPHMRALYDALPAAMAGKWAEESSQIETAVGAAIKPGDVVMVKGSLGSAMGRVVDFLKVKQNSHS